LKPILSIHAALQYISKYASKAEPESKAFSDVLSQILSDSNPDDPSLTSIQKLLLSSVAERDISAQETCHLLLGIPLYHSSRAFISLNVNEDVPRWIRGTGDSGMMINDAGRTTQSPLNKYWNRPSELEEISLFKLYLTYKYVSGKWKQCKNESIVRVRPRPSPLRNGDQWEEFCRVKVILHVQHRSLEELTESGNIPWSALYNQHIDAINADPDDILGQPIDNEDEPEDDESQDEQLEEEEREIYRYDWMRLAEMGPNTKIVSSSDLGIRDMDLNYDWFNDAQKHYSHADIINAREFVRQASSNISNVGEKDDDSVDYQTLNNNQKRVFKRIEAHYNDILAGHKVDPLKIIVMGTAGTGKSYLIRAIRKRLHTMAGNESDVPVLVIAPTGVAAFNINGATIHSTLAIPIINSKNVDLEGDRLKQLQDRLQNIKYLIIDEKSMVGRRMLALIDIRLRQAFPENKDEPFGGRSIIMFGDFGQLPPVLDLPMYTDKAMCGTISNNGVASYKQFREVYKLDVVQRQSEDSEEKRSFRDFLLRAREGKPTIDDWKLLRIRFEGNLDRVERDRFLDAVFLLTKWSDVDRVNIEKLRSLNRPVANILAEHTGRKDAKNADSDVAKGLEAQLLLAKGSRVMLTANLWTKAGLVNGSMGTVQDILFERQGPSSLPTAVFIKFDHYEGPTITSLDGVNVVPIIPIKRTWEKNGTLCSRTQVPLCLAWAITVHKSQGLTLDKAKIDIGDREFAAGLTFVAVSRVRSINGICFKHFNFERLERIKNCLRLQERKNEEERLCSMIP